MIALEDLALQRGPKVLFSGVALRIHAGYRVGVVGRNGTGKSSLLALLRGVLQPDQGDLQMPSGMTIAHVEQETEALPRPAVEFVIDGDSRLRAVEARLAEAEAAGEGERVAHLHGELEALDGYSARARAGSLLHGLGFGDADLERPVSAFSGGWRVRLNLARALMCPSDLLLLDEPTNHLDLDAVIWLEQWLRSYPGTLLLISHDRDFLDNVIEHVLHLDGATITHYRGNYSDFERQHAADLARQQALKARQERDVKRIRAFVDRFRAKATKARQAQSRLKALERMESIAVAHVDAPFRFEFPVPERLPDPLLRLDEAAAGYGGRAVLDGVSLSIRPGMRIGLVGHNGAGKSTLVKLLAGEVGPLGGVCDPDRNTRIGYFAQHQLDQLDPEASAFLHLQRIDPEAGEQVLRDYLGGFGFHGDHALMPCVNFSGGEKARLVLAMLVRKAPSLLLLDEPTNHLDLEMRYALEVALQGYGGALVLVSHDRHLLRTTSDDLLLVADGQVRPFEGDLDDYRQWSASGTLPASSPGGAETSEAVSSGPSHSAGERRAERRRAAERRKRLQPLVARARQLEATLERMGRERDRLEARLADAALYDEAAKAELMECLQAKARVDTGIDETEAEWLELTERLEAEAGEGD